MPFKAQNMSNNAAVTPKGGEIGRAQALQALACGAEPDERMNPVLLKPMADCRSEVVVMGRGRPELSNLHWHERKSHLWKEVTSAYASLAAEADVIVVEGAGSPAEINLRHSDIVNMAVARAWAIPTLLVADIDRGGAFASLYGTWGLLEPEDRSLIHGFLLNKFRGDASLLEPAPSQLEEMTGVPTLGVIPFRRNLLPDEDAQTLQAEPSMLNPGDPEIVIGAVRFPHLSNFDDLDPLIAEPGVRLRWIEDLSGLSGVQAVILPGTRNTFADLEWLRRTGLAERVDELAAEKVPIFGLCGGFQILGQTIADPHGIEGEGNTVSGLGLLGVHTAYHADKRTVLTVAEVVPGSPMLGELINRDIDGYEIHHGQLVLGDATTPWLLGPDGPLGVAKDRVLGCYLHGIFENDEFRAVWLRAIGVSDTASVSWESFLDTQIDEAANLLENAVDVERMLAIARRTGR